MPSIKWSDLRNNALTYKGVKYFNIEKLTKEGKEFDDANYKEVQEIYAEQKEGFLATYNKLAKTNKSSFPALDIYDIVDSTGAEPESKEHVASYMKVFEESLQKIQALDLEWGVGKNGGHFIKDIDENNKKLNQSINTILDLHEAMINLKKWADNSNGSIVSKKQFDYVMNTIFRKGGDLRTFAEKIKQRKADSRDLRNAVTSLYGDFGANLGRAIEDITMNGILKSENFSNFIRKQIGIAVDKNLTGTLASNTALKGTIRGRYIKGDEPKGGVNGMRLADGRLAWTCTGDTADFTLDLAKHTNSTGVSIKRYNLTRSDKISIASLSLRHFADILASIPENAIYKYRNIVASKGKKDGIKYYLARKAIEDIYFGQSLTSNAVDENGISDRTDLMIVNGKLMTVGDFMYSTSPIVEYSGLDASAGSSFVPGSKVPGYVDSVHAAKLKVYADITELKKNILIR